MTKYARQILEIVNKAKEHPTAEQVYLKLKNKQPKVVLATIYNNLNMLYREGYIRKISVEGWPDRYDNATKHDHLVCKVCGKLTDLHVDDLTETLSGQIGEEMLSYELIVKHVCDDCKGRIAAVNKR